MRLSLPQIAVGVLLFASIGRPQTVFPPNNGGSSLIGSCESQSSTPLNCAPAANTVVFTNTNATATYTASSGVLDIINLSTLSANITSFVINSATNGETFEIIATQPSSGGPYTCASPTGFPSIPCGNYPSRTVISWFSYVNSSNIQPGAVQVSGGPGECPQQSDPGSNPPSGVFYTGCDSTAGFYYLNSSGTYSRLVPTSGGNFVLGTPASGTLSNTTTATQTACDNSTKLASTAYTGIACNVVETSGSPLAATAQSQTIWNNTSGAYVVDLPATASGLQVCIGNYKTVAHAVSFVPPSGSTIYYKGVAGTTSSSTGLVSGGAAGDFICVEGVDSTTWLAIGSGSGTWTNN